jgi:hypothetical protein
MEERKSGGRRARIAALVVLVVLIGALSFVIFAPTQARESAPEGFVPLRDDALAERFRPVFDCPQEFGPILAVYYRAAKDASGNIYIAYHPVWERERNDAAGLTPFLSRNLYTGGLSLQRAMFGKGDIESVALCIDPSGGSVTEIDYETAKDYKASDFSVNHQKVVEKGPFSPPLRFRVMSWNHLFSLEEDSPAALERPDEGVALSYFTPKLWKEYEMWKNPQTRLKKDRAHFIWERGAVDQ